MQSHSFLNSQTILVFPYFICFLFINKLLCYQLTLTLTTEISVLVAGGINSSSSISYLMKNCSVQFCDISYKQDVKATL